MSDGVAELAVFVDATSEEVVELAGTHLLELRNHRLRLCNRLVHCVQYCGDTELKRKGRQSQWKLEENVRVQTSHRRTDRVIQ
jgi:hypothetical protein